MRVSNNLSLCGLLLLVLLLTGFSVGKPLEELRKTTDLDELSELSDSIEERSKNKTTVSADQELNTATNQVLAENYKYDVEILESGDNDDSEEESSSEELEEHFKGHGIYNPNTDGATFIAENIEMQPVDVEASAITESHMLLSIVLVVVALISVCVYAGLVIWRSHLEQRYGMRERLINRDVDEEGVDDTDYHVVYPHTLSPYAPTTTTAAPASATMRS